MTQLSVLVKVVPDAASIPWDPERRAVRRATGPLRLSSLDQRALRLALSLRRPGDIVTVLSMGPPVAADVLRGVRAVGADRCVLISDPTLAGADLLVTARVLARALRRLAPDLVITGSESTDGGNGAIDAMLAEALGLPRLGPVRAARWELEGTQIVATIDLPSGSAEFELTGPGVLAVGEKLGKPLHPEPGALDQFPLTSVERWDRASLELPADGFSGTDSPTVVESTVEVPSDRHPTVFAEGTPEERVGHALEEVRRRLESTPPRLLGPPSGAAARSAAGTWVLVTTEDGHLDPSSLPLLSAFPESRAVWIGSTPSDADREALARAGAFGLVAAPEVPSRDPPSVAWAIDSALTPSGTPPAVATVGEPYGREVAARLAFRRGIGLVADVVSWSVDDTGAVRWEKPAFGSGANASISCATRPAVVTVRPGAWPAGEALNVAPLPTELLVLPAGAPRVGMLRRDSTSIDPRGESSELETARWVLVVGMGLGEPAAIGPVASWVRSLGGAIGGTRKVVDAGWLPAGAQVGLTGRHLAPDLAVLAGVGGSAYHLVGLRRARVVVAINADPAADVFHGVDVGIVARWDEVAPFLRTGLAPIAEMLAN